MKKIFYLLIALSLFFLTFQTSNSKEIAENKIKLIDHPVKSSNSILYNKFKNQYDTLIPIFDGLFITYHLLDSSQYFKLHLQSQANPALELFSGESLHPDTKKWGVIDSTGKVIVPFICDGITALSEDSGIVSVFSTSYSLNTGIPRYQYLGHSYSFTKSGIAKETRKEFSIKVEYLADWHHPNFVILKGPMFYLPAEYRQIKF
jgi:hypothetical protein